VEISAFTAIGAVMMIPARGCARITKKSKVSIKRRQRIRLQAVRRPNTAGGPSDITGRLVFAVRPSTLW
jgi:hypothetical protein